MVKNFMLNIYIYIVFPPPQQNPRKIKAYDKIIKENS